MILSGHEIKRRLGKDVVLEPFDESRLNPNSYNLSLHDELMVYEEVVLDMRKANRVRRTAIPAEGLVLQPHQLYLGRTVERTAEGPQAGAHHRIRIRPRRGRDPRGEGRRGETVIGGQREDRVQTVDCGTAWR